MSFGFGIGDFIAVLNLAAQVRQRWSDAPAEYATARNEIKQLETILKDLNDLGDRIEISPSQKDMLVAAVANCRNVLTTANKIVDSYSTAATSKLRRTWQRFKADPQDVRNLRGQLVSTVAQLQLIQNNIQIELDRDIYEHVQESKAAHDDESKLRIANWFSAPAFAEQQTAQLDLHLSGTGNWFLQHPVYQAWRTGAHDTLYCPGIAGSGKSVIFATAVQDLQNYFEHDSSVVVAYFYCNYKRQDEQRFPRILSALTRQLFQEQPSVPDVVKLSYEKNIQRGAQPSTDELCTLVLDLCNMYQRVFILIDAVDECTDGDESMTRSKLLSYLVSLQTQSDASVSIMTTCRPSIVTVFNKSPKIDISAHHDDITRYLNANIQTIIPCLVNHPNVQAQVVEGIAQIVDGMFLLARLHLESMRDKTKIRAVLQAMKTLPRGSASAALDKAYHEVLERINLQLHGFRNLAIRTLTWMTNARRELNLDELREALAIEPDMDDIDPEIDLDDENTILSVCAGLVVVDQERTVRLAHYTTQVYLESNKERWSPDGGEYVARSCINYLSMNVFYINGVDWARNYYKLAQHYKFLRYAGEYWPYHGQNFKTVREYHDMITRKPDVFCFASQLVLAIYNPSYEWYGYFGRNVTMMHICAFVGDMRLLDYLINEGQNFNAVGDSQAFSIHDGALVFILTMLMQFPVGSTPLSFASYQGHNKVVVKLLAQDDIDVNAPSRMGEMPLEVAVNRRNIDIVKQLLSRPDLRINDQDGFLLQHLDELELDWRSLFAGQFASLGLETMIWNKDLGVR